jgi:signal transduction histidine kinase
LRRVPIRLKLAAALSIPLLALAVVTVFEVLKAGRERDEVRSQTQLAEAATGPSGLITALQNERTWPAVDLIGQSEQVTIPVPGYERTRGETDEALAQFREQIGSKDPLIAEAFKPALDGLVALEQLRSDIDQNVTTTPNRTMDNNIDFSREVFSRYTELISPFFDATTRISLAIDDPELRQGTEMADAAARQIEDLSLLLNGIIGDAFQEGGTKTAAQITEASVNHERFKTNAATMLAGTGPYADVAAEHFPADLTDRVNKQADLATSGGEIDISALLEDVNVPADEGYAAYQQAVADEIERRSGELNDAASARQRWFIALAVLVLGAAVMLTWLVSRSITKPLRSLTRQAKDMAERRLPEVVMDILDTPLGEDVSMPTTEPVRLETRDEVADVAVALNTVQDTALDLAVEQAVLRRNIADSFVNLGRRNQNLLGRQLDFITELETNETNPDTLANLFRLDHLATRMRRNAESLLVLAGIEPPRKWAAPVRLTDVIRAALGEVEDYQRVTVRGVEPATIIGNAAADLAHLLAELIENALVFSPPDQTVDIRGRNRPDPHRSRPDSDTTERDQYGPGYTLAVIDSGLGMPTTDITAANRRLAGAESFTIAPSKYLGHYVAGNLAARHNITVHLDNSPGNGITATIDLPPTLLTTDTGTASGPDGPASRDHALAGPPTAAALPGGNGSAHLAPAGARPPAPAPPRLDPAPPRPADAPPADAPWPATAAPQREPAPAAPSVTAAPPLAARAPGDPTEPPPGRTPSGLVKRSPRAPAAGEPARAASNAADDSLLASLSQYARGRGLGHPTAPAPPPAAPPAPPPAAPAPRPAPMPGPPPGLTRRVRGAQLPTTSPVPLRRGPEPAPGRPLRYVQPADDVYRFLTDFTAGVRRGLDDMNQGRSA